MTTPAVTLHTPFSKTFYACLIFTILLSGALFLVGSIFTTLITTINLKALYKRHFVAFRKHPDGMINSIDDLYTFLLVDYILGYVIVFCCFSTAIFATVTSSLVTYRTSTISNAMIVTNPNSDTVKKSLKKSKVSYYLSCYTLIISYILVGLVIAKLVIEILTLIEVDRVLKEREKWFDRRPIIRREVENLWKNEIIQIAVGGFLFIAFIIPYWIYNHIVTIRLKSYNSSVKEGYILLNQPFL
ncbi:hypothetical protein ABK040_004357 [Willaertia magna]